MMVIGSRAALQYLAQQLTAATDGSVTNNEPSPKELFSPWTEGPYRDISDYTLSFHLRGTAPLRKNFPHARNNPFLTPVLIGILVFALVGAITIVRGLGALVWQLF